MRATPLLILGVTGCCLLSSQPKWRATAEQMSPMGPIDPQASSAIGPLALVPGAGTTPHPAVQEARRRADDRYLDRARIHEETTAFLSFLDTFYQPLTPEMRIGFEQAHRDLATLEKLDPYSVSSVTLAYQQSTQRLHLCIHNAGITWPCDRDRKPHPAHAGAFEVDQVAPGIMKLTVRDLGDAADPSWRAFPAATRTLADARALVLDLRDAGGADPRPLLPWLGELTGRPDLRPLRAIERPASADAFVAAYASRFTDRGRDPDIWRALVGTGGSIDTARTAPTKKPIAVVVGRNCDSACELVARVLEAYAGAVVIGGVLPSGRLARDEPAMFVLPHSQTTVYFHATRYLLATDIEAVSGPTEEWRMFSGDGFDDLATLPNDPFPRIDYLTWALREVQQRLVDPAGWPRCDALRPAAEPQKLHGLSYLTSGMCTDGYQITLRSGAPSSVLQRFLATCPSSITLGTAAGSIYWLRASGPKDAAAISQAAASELVGMIQIECQRRMYPN